MREWRLKIRSADEALDIIINQIEEMGLRTTDVESTLGVSKGMISRWKKVGFYAGFKNFLKLLWIIHAEILLIKVESVQKIRIEEYDDFIALIEQIEKPALIEEKMEISKGMISRWKSKKMIPSLPTVMSLFDAMEFEVFLSTTSDDPENDLKFAIKFILREANKEECIKIIKLLLDKIAKNT